MLAVHGQAKYADDIVLPRMLYGRLLRSTQAHARIKKVDVSRALAYPGVVGNDDGAGPFEAMSDELLVLFAAGRVTPERASRAQRGAARLLDYFRDVVNRHRPVDISREAKDVENAQVLGLGETRHRRRIRRTSYCGRSRSPLIIEPWEYDGRERSPVWSWWQSRSSREYRPSSREYRSSS